MLTKSLLDEAGVDKSLIDELILGQVLGAGCEQNVARQALINSGLSVEKTAFIVNMLCGSIGLGYDAISLNRADLLLCGGVENMSLAPLFT
ncbi:Acetyl-CoA acetyltransferase [Campylobacter upsaliensis]|uniref:Acetyl-CoA acetyltransferase n=1 Tax=Campylobacter upsaliensis TaxID=28080 RepID=A0A3S4WP37_CAMUP|nr:Acetyl-CoA acetyltransferase [Campylobacter upsaliensis]